MNNKIITCLIFILFINITNSTELKSQINNSILVKVGNSLITAIDLENEIKTNLIINGQELSQININNNKGYSVKNLINKSIKNAEINKFGITNYNKQDLKKYVNKIAKNLNTNPIGLKKIFVQNNISYDYFIKNYEIELLWNTLIYQIYKNQISINIIDVENEVKNFKGGNSETKTEIEVIKKNILYKKKEEKLTLFSRSHFSNLENTITIDFK